jgi:NitT/TauT family transport system permease protein
MGNVIEKRTSLIASFLAVLLAVVVWQFLALNNNPQLIPSPAKVASGMLELAESGLLWESILAIPLGLLAGTSMLARGALDPFIHFFRFVPALALTSLFILWFGIGESSKVNLIAYAVTFLVLVTTAAGASSINPDKILGARTLGANRFDLFFRIILPATFPSIFIGMRLALASAFLVIVAAEAIAAQEGIGFLIWNSRTFFRTDFMFVGILCFGILGFISDRLWKLLGQTFLSRYLTDLGDY